MQPYNDRAPIADVAKLIKNAHAEDVAAEVDETKIPQPEISIIVDGNKIFKPGMKSVFIEADDSVTVGEHKDLTGGVYCTCNSVCTCESVTICSCQGVCGSNCSCNSNRGGGGCSCAPVH